MNMDKLIKNVAEDFKAAVKNYRKAREEQEIEEPYFSTWEEELERKYNIQEKTRKDSINTSKDYIKLTREEYWQNIIIAKIEVIGAIGGFELMQEFSIFLRSIDDEDLHLESAFCYYADGICGWYR